MCEQTSWDHQTVANMPIRSWICSPHLRLVLGATTVSGFALRVAANQTERTLNENVGLDFTYHMTSPVVLLDHLLPLTQIILQQVPDL